MNAGPSILLGKIKPCQCTVELRNVIICSVSNFRWDTIIAPCMFTVIVCVFLKHCFVVGSSGQDDNRSFQHNALTPAFWTVIFTAGGTRDGHRERLFLSPLPQLLNSLWTLPLNYGRSHHVAGVPRDARRTSSHSKKVPLEIESPLEPEGPF